MFVFGGSLQLTWALALALALVLLSAEVLNKVSATVNDPSVKSVAIVVADVADDASLRAMAARARVVLDCVGPVSTYADG